MPTPVEAHPTVSRKYTAPVKPSRPSPTIPWCCCIRPSIIRSNLISRPRVTAAVWERGSTCRVRGRSTGNGTLLYIYTALRCENCIFDRLPWIGNNPLALLQPFSPKKMGDLCQRGILLSLGWTAPSSPSARSFGSGGCGSSTTTYELSPPL